MWEEKKARIENNAKVLQLEQLADWLYCLLRENCGKEEVWVGNQEFISEQVKFECL